LLNVNNIILKLGDVFCLENRPASKLLWLKAFRTCLHV
jgi:hypothetical protein